jgi:hypothetical protein
MAGEIARIEGNYVALASAVSYLLPQNGGQIIAAADPATVLSIETISPPGLIIVFDGEQAQGKNFAIGGAFQEGFQVWSFFLVAASFSDRGEGRSGAQGAYQMVDDLMAAIDGQIVSLEPAARAFFVSERRYAVYQASVVYQVKFRNGFTRQGAAAT